MSDIHRQFELGRHYRHASGRAIAIVGSAFTTQFGPCLVAEEASGQLVPIGAHEGAAAGWENISDAECGRLFTGGMLP